MKGILKLVDLNRNHPDNIAVLYQLGRLAIETGQYKKAVLRLEKVLSLSPENKRAICLLAIAYQKTGNEVKADQFAKQCE